MSWSTRIGSIVKDSNKIYEYTSTSYNEPLSTLKEWTITEKCLVHISFNILEPTNPGGGHTSIFINGMRVFNYMASSEQLNCGFSILLPFILYPGDKVGCQVDNSGNSNARGHYYVAEYRYQ